MYIQNNEVEVENHITDEKKPFRTSTLFIVSSNKIRPYDLCISFFVTINGGQTPHTVTVVRKASKKCVCQVFYHKEGLNCWKVRFAFFSEHLLDVRNMSDDSNMYDNGEIIINLATSVCFIVTMLLYLLWA